MTLDRRSLIAAGLALGVGGRAVAQVAPGDPAEEILLWPGGAPGMPATPPVETVVTRDPGTGGAVNRAVSGIAKPRLTMFRAERPNGAAMLITPGGGYRRVVIDHEGYEVARWLNGFGVTAFVLRYRLPGEGWADRANVSRADAQRAIRLIRARANDYAIDPARVAVMGFSAGGHVCADLAARFAAQAYAPIDAADRLPARPHHAAPIYPVVSMDAAVAHAGSRELLLGPNASPALEAAHSVERNIPADAPPHFLVHAADDAVVPIANSLRLDAALRAKNIPVELHAFTRGSHGFGLNGPPWPALWQSWARSISFI